MMTWAAYALVATLAVLIGSRAWMLFRYEAPAVRASGSVLSALVPVPVFLIVVAYHYAKRARMSRPRSSL